MPAAHYGKRQGAAVYAQKVQKGEAYITVHLWVTRQAILRIANVNVFFLKIRAAIQAF